MTNLVDQINFTLKLHSISNQSMANMPHNIHHICRVCFGCSAIQINFIYLFIIDKIIWMYWLHFNYNTYQSRDRMICSPVLGSPRNLWRDMQKCSSEIDAEQTLWTILHTITITGRAKLYCSSTGGRWKCIIIG